VIEREIAIGRRTLAAPPREATLANEELDWQHIGIFAVGTLLGAALGAGAALLFAPQSGAETRHRLVHRGRRFREQTTDAWDDLRDELRYAARRGKRKIGRRWTRAKRERQLKREFRDRALTDD
jgi:hypothetical protein